jgi:hypothetical protein
LRTLMTFRAELSLELDEPLMVTAPWPPGWEPVERAKPWGESDHGPSPTGCCSRPAHYSTDAGRRYLRTNGARDPCCAIRGPAVAQVLARAAGQVYECSPGGHRFAANVSCCRTALLRRPSRARRPDSRRARRRTAAARASPRPDGVRAQQQAAEILVRRKLARRPWPAPWSRERRAPRSPSHGRRAW